MMDSPPNGGQRRPGSQKSGTHSPPDPGRVREGERNVLIGPGNSTPRHRPETAEPVSWRHLNPRAPGWTVLRLLNVTNFATVDHLELELGEGFTVLTGETGAGKSIIVDAVGLLLGGRADSTVVRAGEAQTRVDGAFTVSEAAAPALQTALAEHGLDADFDGEIILGREINPEGRNVCRVNGRLVPMRTLAAIGANLVDIHGQGEQLSLLKQSEQLAVLDRYGGLEDDRVSVASPVGQLAAVRKELKDTVGDEAEVARLVDTLRFQINEIEKVGLEVGEDVRLRRERDVLQNAEQVQSLIGEALSNLVDGGEGRTAVVDKVGSVLQALLRLETIDPSFTFQREAVEGFADQADEIARSLRAYLDTIDPSGDRLAEAIERLDAIARIERKYGPTVEGVLSFASGAKEELAQLERSDERRAELTGQAGQLLHDIGVAASGLSNGRSDAASRFAPAIEAELADLALEGTRVEIEVSQRPAESDGVEILGAGSVPTGRYSFDASGIDAVDLLIAPNRGEPLRPAAKTASGGETSRLMLAIKTVLTAADAIPTLIFDEVDAGIGGRLGATVGQKLSALSHEHQVLCVTHLPQIAAVADRHILVRKNVSDDRTVTSVLALDGEQRVEEIAQMLGTTSDAGVSSAEEMLAEAFDRKTSETAHAV